MDYMLEARDFIDQEIWWQPNCGHSSIMFDNWTHLGALCYYLPVSHSKELMQKMLSNYLRIEDGMNIFYDKFWLTMLLNTKI